MATSTERVGQVKKISAAAELIEWGDEFLTKYQGMSNCDWLPISSLYREIKTDQVNPRSLATYTNKSNALNDFTQAIELAENDTERYYVFRGYAKEKEKAEDCARDLEGYNKALVLEPYALSDSTRGYVKEKQGCYEESLEDCNKAIELTLDNAVFHTSRGCAYQAFGNTKKEKADFSAAHALKSQQAST